MWGKILLLLLLFLAISFSIQQRIRLQQKRNLLNQVPDAPISSFLSEALAQLVGVAGGVYLSLIMVVSFLELELPSQILVAGMTMQPLAFIALGLAILQPLVKQIFYYLYKR